MSTSTDTPFAAPAAAPAVPPLEFTPVDDDAVDIDPVEAARLAIYNRNGWLRVDKNGRTVPDDLAVKNAV